MAHRMYLAAGVFSLLHTLSKVSVAGTVCMSLIWRHLMLDPSLLHTSVIACAVPRCKGSVAFGLTLPSICNALMACRRKGAPRGKQRHLPAGLGRRSRLPQLLSILKRWSSCSQSQPQHCCRQQLRMLMQQPGGSMPLHAGSC